ncbi:MAG TPA: GntR family transcriptional regulator [Stellaceae bacterium]|nr:GntR family transcriptional regulator [Stellaceae bacterium]
MSGELALRRYKAATAAKPSGARSSDVRRVALRPIGGRAHDARQLGEVVADAIVDAVAQGTLEPLARIKELDLARQLGVSRVPIREAIKLLQAQGILNVTPNRGARVAPFDPPMIEQVYEARIALERIAVRDALAAYRREPRLLDGLREIISRMERMARWSDWVEFRKCDVAFHREICRASGNEIVLKLWEALAQHITIIFGRELASERNFAVVIDQHRKLLDMFESGDRTLEQVIEGHIVRLRGAAAKSASNRGQRGTNGRRTASPSSKALR